MSVEGLFWEDGVSCVAEIALPLAFFKHYSINHTCWLVTAFSAATNCSFSLVWVKICGWPQ